MSTNESPDNRESRPIPMMPELLQEKLHSALKERGYVESDSILPGYRECVTQSGVEISCLIEGMKPEIRVDVNVLAYGIKVENFGESYSGGNIKYLSYNEQIFCTEINFEEVLENLVDIGERGMEIVRLNPDNRLE